MKQVGKVTITARGAREIRVERDFDAPRQLVFDAHSKPDLIRRWLLGPGDWSMPVCEVDFRVGGSYRFVWSHANKPDMGLSGEYREIDEPGRIVHTEVFDDPWYPGSCTVTTVLTEVGGKTRLSLTMRFDSEEARDIALASPMDEGLAGGYERLDGVLADLA